MNAISVSESTVYVGGTFFNIGGQSRSRIAALDAGTGAATTWNPSVGDEVKTLALQSGTVYAGGTFVSIGGDIRNNLAAVNVSTGQLTSWNPNADGTVYSMALGVSTVYVGGNYSNVGGQSRSYFAALNTTDGSATSWIPNVGNQVRSIAVSGSTVYIGGLFTAVGGQTRNMIAALDATLETNNLISGWNPGAAVNVRALAISGSTLYAGGDFTTIGGQSRKYLAALNASDGTVTSWNPNPNASVLALAANGTTIYAGGDFTIFSPTASPDTCLRIAAFNATTGTRTSWNPSASASVWSIAVSGSAVYVGGSFSSFSPNGGTAITRNRLAALNINTGIPMSWDPNSGGTVNSVTVGSTGIYAGGGFTAMGGISRRYLALFPITSVDWGGSSGGNWNEAANWAPGIVPTASLDASVSMGSPVLNTDYTLPSGKTLTLSGTGSLTVAAGKTLTIAGTADFGGRPVTLKSTTSGTASLGQMTGTLSNAGSVTVERYIPAARKWRFLTAPLVGASNNSVYRNWQNNGTPSGATGIDIWGAGGTATPSTGVNGLQSGPSASMRSYGAAGWADVTDTKSETGTRLFDGSSNNAFSVFVKGPFNNGNTAVNAGDAAVATTLSATGTPITGTHTKTLSASPSAGQYFLVGNPYASAVNPAQLSGNNLTNTFWMWDATTSGGSGAGSYVAFNRSPAPGTYNVTSGGFTNSPTTTHIQSGQAFFARASVAGEVTTITFEESDKSSATGGGMFGPQQVPDEYGTLRLTLCQDSGAAQPKNLDGAVAFFYANGNPEVDGMDGSKLMNSSENLFFRRTGRSLTFEHRPVVEARDTLFLRMGNLHKTSYRLTVEGSKLGKDVEFALVDRLTGMTTLMDSAGSRSYDFTVTDDSLSTGDRFTVQLSRPLTQSLSPEGSSLRQGLRLHPNPARDLLRVTLGVSRAGATLLQVFDARGVELLRGDLDASGSADVDVSRLPSGLYTLLLTDAKGEKTVGKFVRE